MNKTIVYVRSTGFAGSHFLSLMLGSNSRAMHLGEAKQIIQPELTEVGYPCYLCKDERPCPVFSGIDAQNINRIYDIIFSRIDPKVEALIDISKPFRGWVKQFLNRTDYNLKFIHLIRDPRALARRWMTAMPPWKQRRERRRISLRTLRVYPRVGLSMPWAEQSTIFLYKWLFENQKITRSIADYKLDACIVTYHDLVKDTHTELKRLTQHIGLQYEPGQVEYWNFEHHGTQKIRYEWVKEQKAQHFDLRWKTFFSAEIAGRMAANPHVNQYLAKIGLRFVEDGLTRKAPDIV